MTVRKGWMQTMVRMPIELHSALVKGSEENGCSMNAEIVERLKASFETGDRTLSKLYHLLTALPANEFARGEECMTNPGEPTAAVHRGAEMLRKLYRSR